MWNIPLGPLRRVSTEIEKCTPALISTTLPLSHYFRRKNSNALFSRSYSMLCKCGAADDEDASAASAVDRPQQEASVTSAIQPLHVKTSLFDAHCHLQLPPLCNFSDRAVALAVLNGVDKISVCGTSPGKDWNEVLNLWRTYDNVIIPSFGLHPWWIARVVNSEINKEIACTMDDAVGTGKDWGDQLDDMISQCPHAHVGECGLDKAVVKDGVSMEQQESILWRHLQIAAEYKRSITLHCVSGCWERLISLLKQFELEFKEDNLPPLRAIILHSCNSLPDHLLRQFLRLRSNTYFSISAGGRAGLTTRTISLIRAIPQDRMLIETDSPDQLPASLRWQFRHKNADIFCQDQTIEATPESENKTLTSEDIICVQYNEPALVAYNCAAVAEILELNVTALAARTRENAFTAFQLIV